MVSFFVKFKACMCNADGSSGITCGADDGKCDCKNNVMGDKCTQCVDGTYGFPDCQGSMKIKNAEI